MDQAAAKFVRYSVQGYFVGRAPRLVHYGAGLRLSLLTATFRSINDEPSDLEGRPLAVEPFGFARLGAPWVQLELQLRYTGVVNQPRAYDDWLVVPEQFTIIVGLRFVFGPEITLAWPPRTRRVRPPSVPAWGNAE